MANPLSSGSALTSEPLELNVVTLSKLVVIDLTLETVAYLKGVGLLLVRERGETISGADLLATSIFPFNIGVACLNGAAEPLSLLLRGFVTKCCAMLKSLEIPALFWRTGLILLMVVEFVLVIDTTLKSSSTFVELVLLLLEMPLLVCKPFCDGAVSKEAKDGILLVESEDSINEDLNTSPTTGEFNVWRGGGGLFAGFGERVIGESRMEACCIA